MTVFASRFSYLHRAFALRWGVLAAVGTLLLCSATQSLSAQSRRDSTTSVNRSRPISRSINVDRNATIEIVGRSGDITVRAHTDSRVQLESTSDEQIDVSGGGRSVRINVAADGRRRSSDNLEVIVPEGSVLLIRTQSGNVTVSGVGGDLEVQSTSGDIRVTDVGRLRVDNVTGDITATHVNEGARINTTAGSITLEDVDGDVELTGTSSDVVLRDARSVRVQVRVVSGDINYTGLLHDNGRYELATHSGDVTLTVPRDSRAMVDVQSFSGDVSSMELPLMLLPDRASAAQEAQNEANRAERNAEQERLRLQRDSLRRALEDSVRRSTEPRSSTRRDSLSFERSLERSVERLVESVLRNVASQLESISFQLDAQPSGRGRTKTTRLQLGDGGGPLVSISTFSGDVVLRADRTARRP